MGLNAYLSIPTKSGPKGSGIFVREDGQTKEISRAEWDEKFPGREPVVLVDDSDEGMAALPMFEANLTHNVRGIANAALIGDHLWFPEKIGITTARQLIEPLTVGLANLKANSEKYRALEPANGWGSVGGLIRFVEEYLAAAKKWPDAQVSVSR